MDIPTEDKKSVSFDDLQDRFEKLTNLLKERQTGMFTWHTFLNEQLQEVHDILCPIYGGRD